ncbi:MAG: adenylate/guanylate cyclase domain-containing protein, partial [Nitriliruptorales bacterium]|nr:adenylate/guanylate cyclase domain-containing protein [Nitriliruptorales bacterium]
MAGDTTTLTYLFSDLEGSTRLWEQHPESMHDALARHDTILREAVEDAGGSVVKTTGDGLMAAFDDASAAVTASLRAQRALRDEPWGETGPLRVRIGMHIGESQPRAGDFYGSDVNRAARVMAAAHGGQILLTAAVAERLRGALPDSVGLRGLGSHRLKDLAGPAELLQVTAPDLGHDFPPLNTLDARPNNLPTQASAFLGRDDVLEQLEEILDTGKTRLVTLTGPGGTGKTRLALQAAAAQIDRHRDGVFFVDLSAERDPRPAFAAIIRTVGIGASAEDPPLEVLKSGLEGSELLLVLDNLEQVTAIGPGLVELLAHCPDVTILGTSREALRVRGEQLLPTPPLSLPMSNDGAVTVKGAVESEAVRLFEERASEIRPDFAITEDNVADVVAICRRLDGLPLAIELAAARINLFGVDELRTRLAERFDVLKGGARDLPERQQTLRSTIEWSDDLLSEEERRILWLFSVFVGARVADVEATAERVPTLGVGDVLEPLGSLVDKSLLRNTVEVSGQRRLTMLQTIRAYASEQLAAHPDLAAAVRRAHAEHYTAVANQWRGQLARKDREAVLAALSDELGNIRAAWDHWVEEQDVVRLNELIEPLWGYHDAKGEYGAAVELANDLLAVLEIQPETPERIRDEIALEMSLARSLIAVHGYTAEVERKIREAVERSGSGPRTPQRFPVLRSLATLHLLRMEFEDATAIGRELLDIAEEQGDRALLSEAHLVYGLNTSFGEDLEEGLGHLDRSIELFD